MNAPRAADRTSVTPPTDVRFGVPADEWRPPAGVLITQPPLELPPKNVPFAWYPPGRIAFARRGYGLTAKLLCLATAVLGFYHLYPWAAVAAVLAGIFLFSYGIMVGADDSRNELDISIKAELEEEVQRERWHAAAEQRPCGIRDETPGAQAGHGFTYVIRFSTGAVKVGQTIHPRRRLFEHGRDASAYRVAITSYWISPAHLNFAENEDELIRFCRQFGVGVKKEYFHGMDFLAVVRMASSQTFTTRDHLAGGR